MGPPTSGLPAKAKRFQVWAHSGCRRGLAHSRPAEDEPSYFTPPRTCMFSLLGTHMCELLLNMVQHKLGRADVKQQLRKMSTLIVGQARYLSGVLKSSNTFLFRLYMALLMNSRELQVDGLRCWGDPLISDTSSARALFPCLCGTLLTGPNFPVVRVLEMKFRKRYQSIIT